MIKRLCTLLLITASLVTTSASAEEQIINFNSNIQIHQNSSLTITETIKVKAEGHNIRRGIYREFPTNYNDRLGNNYQVAFDIVSVTQNNNTVEWHTRDLRNGVRLYIGDEDSYLSPGIYTYEITYKTNHQLGYYPDVDELYWNVTGNDWKFNIQQALVTINFPKSISQNAIQYKAFTGYQGSTKTDVKVTNHTSEQLSLETTRSLLPSEGFTIQVGLPKGYVDEPSSLESFQLLLSQNRHLLIFLIGLIVTFVYYYFVWSKHGRDPKPGVIIPLYDPPQKESPAAMRYVLRNYYDPKTFTTALISLAVKGYITIEELDDDEYAIKKTNKTVKFSAGEQKLADSLFDNTDSVKTNEEDDKTLFRAAMLAHKKSLADNYKSTYFNINGKYLFIGLLLSIATVVIGAIFRHPFAEIGISVIVISVLLILMNTTFGILLKAPTAIGRKFMDKAEGLKDYLTIAESDALRSRYPLEKTPQSFERYLPYAFALDIEDAWGDYFGDTLEKQLADDSSNTNAAYTLPLWYHASNTGALSFSSMTNSLNDTFSSSVSAAATPPGSSSSSGFSGGGGGFSGGGSGGGGGGGW